MSSVARAPSRRNASRRTERAVPGEADRARPRRVVGDRVERHDTLVAAVADPHHAGVRGHGNVNGPSRPITRARLGVHGHRILAGRRAQSGGGSVPRQLDRAADERRDRQADRESHGAPGAHTPAESRERPARAGDLAPGPRAPARPARLAVTRLLPGPRTGAPILPRRQPRSVARPSPLPAGPARVCPRRQRLARDRPSREMLGGRSRSRARTAVAAHALRPRAPSPRPTTRRGHATSVRRRPRPMYIRPPGAANPSDLRGSPPRHRPQGPRRMPRARSAPP